MRGMAWLMVLMCGWWLTGCGGGSAPAPAAKPLTAEPYSLRVTTLNWQYGLPQNIIKKTYTTTAKLWLPQNAAILSAPQVVYPWSATGVLFGPSLIPATDGTNQKSVPYAVLWGCGETIPPLQPRVVQPQQSLPGYVRPANDMYLYASKQDLDGTRNLAGTYRLTADGGYARTWTVGGTQPMLPIANITAPQPYVYTMQSKKPFVFAWDPVPGATGYLVNIEADVTNDKDEVIGRLVWTSASQPIIFSAVYDFTPYLLPAGVRNVTVPAHIFNGCKSIQVDLLAIGPTTTRRDSDLTLQLVNASVTSLMYVVVKE